MRLPIRTQLATAALALLLAPAPAFASYKVTCESIGNRYQYCNAKTEGNVRLDEQLSHSACRQGRDWGYDWDGVWVSNGCRARFEVGAGRHGSGGRDDAGNAIAAAAGIAVLGAIIANADSSNARPPHPQRPPHPSYSGVPPWAVGSFYGQAAHGRRWQTIAIDPNGGVVRYEKGYPPVYGNFSERAIWFGYQGMAVAPERGGILIEGAFFRRQ